MFSGINYFVFDYQHIIKFGVHVTYISRQNAMLLLQNLYVNGHLCGTKNGVVASVFQACGMFGRGLHGVCAWFGRAWIS